MKKLSIVFLFCTMTAILFPFAAFAQNKTVSGNVTFADDGSAAIGVYVSVEGSNLGAMTDLDGNFSIANVPAKAEYVVAKFMGCKDARVKIAPNMKIVLESDYEMLNEVVVTGMQQMDRRLFTGSAAKVNAEEAKLNGVSDISRSLEGRVAGVSVQNVSGTFGTAPKIRVRGATSIYGSSKPLWVVDGVIMTDVVDVSADELSSGDASTLISSAIAGLNDMHDVIDGTAAVGIPLKIPERICPGISVITHIAYTGVYRDHTGISLIIAGRNFLEHIRVISV